MEGGVKLTPVACSYRQRPDLRINTAVQEGPALAVASESVSSLFLRSFNSRDVAGSDEDEPDTNA